MLSPPAPRRTFQQKKRRNIPQYKKVNVLRNSSAPAIQKNGYSNLKYNQRKEKEDEKERFERRLKREKNRITRFKKEIVEENGLEPTICYYYYLWNAVDYVGEQRLRESFASIKGQGNEIIVGDYGSTDKTREIALEHGFKVVNVEKTEGIKFHEPKIANKVMSETKCNFLVDLNANTIYPKNMDDFYKPWINKDNVIHKLLVGRGIFDDNGRLERDNSASCLFYRPYLIKLRGYDERTYYGFGATHYAYCLLVDVLKLELDNKPLDMIHKYHRDFKHERLREVFNLTNQMQKHEEAIKMVEPLLDVFLMDIDKAILNVQNSYF